MCNYVKTLRELGCSVHRWIRQLVIEINTASYSLVPRTMREHLVIEDYILLAYMSISLPQVRELTVLGLIAPIRIISRLLIIDMDDHTLGDNLFMGWLIY